MTTDRHINDRRINDRQLNAVLGAIAEHHSGGFTEALAIANAAIEASDAKYVPMLAEALILLDKMKSGLVAFEEMFAVKLKVEQALASLPPELRGE